MLTRQQNNVFKFLIQGFSNIEIARELGIKEATVKSHVNALFKLAFVKSRARFLVKYFQDSEMKSLFQPKVP